MCGSYLRLGKAGVAGSLVPLQRNSQCLTLDAPALAILGCFKDRKY